MLTSTSEVLTPAELSMASVLSRPPLRQFDARELGHAEIGAFADHLGAELVRRHPDRIVGAIATRSSPSLAARTKVPMPPKKRRSAVRLEGWRGAPRSASPSPDRPRLPAPSAISGIALSGARRRHRPARSASGRSPASSSAADRTAAGARRSCVAGSGSGSMKMSRWSKAATSFVAGESSMPVAEHVARHVADADHRERRRLDVDVHLAEVPLHRLPGAARRDPHLLVVVAVRAAGGEGVAEPEAVRLGDARWRCRRTSPCPCRRRPRDRDRRRRGAPPAPAARRGRRRDCR